jgi:hypothetical protein
LNIEDHYTTKRQQKIKSGFHKEHVIHTEKNNIKNCIPSCKSCNCKKWTSTLNGWYNENNPIYSYESNIIRFVSGLKKIYRLIKDIP